jgi:hypothetical protein
VLDLAELLLGLVLGLLERLALLFVAGRELAQIGQGELLGLQVEQEVEGGVVDREVAEGEAALAQLFLGREPGGAEEKQPILRAQELPPELVLSPGLQDQQQIAASPRSWRRSARRAP